MDGEENKKIEEEPVKVHGKKPKRIIKNMIAEGKNSDGKLSLNSPLSDRSFWYDKKSVASGGA